MNKDTLRNTAPGPAGSSMLKIYRQVGCGSTALTPDTAEGRLPIRDDLRDNGNLLGAAVGVFLQDLAGVNVAYHAPLVVPTEVTVHLCDSARDVAALRADGELVRRGRTTMVTRARIVDEAHPDRLVGYGTASWATMASTLDAPPEKLRSTPVTVPETPQPPLVQWIGAVERADGRGLEVREVVPEMREPVALGGPDTQTLHGGPIQILAEGAARLVAERHVGGRAVMTRYLSTHLLSPARRTPFAALATVLSDTNGSLDCQVEVREDGGDGKIVALCYARFAASP